MFYIFVVQHNDDRRMYTIAMCRDCLAQLTDHSSEAVNRMMVEHKCSRTMLSKSVNW